MFFLKVNVMQICLTRLFANQMLNFSRNLFKNLHIALLRQRNKLFQCIIMTYHFFRTRLCNAQTAAKEIHNSSPKRSGSLGRTFVRSYTVNGDQGFDQIPKNGFNKKRNGLRVKSCRFFICFDRVNVSFI